MTEFGFLFCGGYAGNSALCEHAAKFMKEAANMIGVYKSIDPKIVREFIVRSTKFVHKNTRCDNNRKIRLPVCDNLTCRWVYNKKQFRVEMMINNVFWKFDLIAADSEFTMCRIYDYKINGVQQFLLNKDVTQSCNYNAVISDLLFGRGRDLTRHTPVWTLSLTCGYPDIVIKTE